MEQGIDVSVIIVSWNTKSLLQQCLLSILRQKLCTYEIIVVDNNSSDGTQEMLKNEFKGINAIYNTQNRGFAAANNQALRIAKGNAILLLNPDTEFQNSTDLQKLLAFQKEKNAGIVGPRLVYPSGENQESVRTFPDWLSQCLLLLKIHILFPGLPIFKNFLLHNFDYSKTQQVDQVSGACFCIERSCLKKIGLLDEGFWIWFEEVDYCKRTKNAGFTVWYFSDIQVTHYGGQSFQQVLPKDRQKKYNKSLRRYAKKYFSSWQTFLLTLVNPISLFLAFLTPSKNKPLSYRKK
jgi:hypothetical protein